MPQGKDSKWDLGIEFGIWDYNLPISRISKKQTPTAAVYNSECTTWCSKDGLQFFKVLGHHGKLTVLKLGNSSEVGGGGHEQGTQAISVVIMKRGYGNMVVVI